MNEPAAAGQPPAPHASAATATPPVRVAGAILWVCLLAVVGGLVVGLALTKFAMLGAIVLWGIGALGGWVSRKLTKGPSRAAAWCLVTACLVAFSVGEASWYRWSYTIPDPVTGEHRDPTWVEAFTRVPRFLWQHAPIALAVGALFTILGAQSAYQQAGKRERIVIVAEE